MDRIPALSVRQPWAELIVTGKKTIEIRSWSTDYRGLLWIHTGLKGTPELESILGLKDLFTGGYVGSAVLDGVVHLDRNRWQQWSPRHLCSYESYRPGLFGWVLSSALKFSEPIQGPGQLGLFDPGDRLNELLNQAEPANHLRD
jgi:hypothetical protein